MARKMRKSTQEKATAVRSKIKKAAKGGRRLTAKDVKSIVGEKKKRGTSKPKPTVKSLIKKAKGGSRITNKDIKRAAKKKGK